AKARYDLAKTSFDRIKSLYESQAASKQEYDEANTNLITAQAALDKAQASVEYAKATLNQAQHAVDLAKSKISETQAQVGQANASYESANVSVEDATVRAPFDGMVIDTLVHVGDMASPGTALVRIERAPYFLETYLDERKQNEIHIGDAVPVMIGALNRTMTGTIAEMTPHIDPTSRKFRVKVALSPSTDIISGMFGIVAFSDGGERSIFVPDSAIIRWTQFTGVYVVDEQGIAHLRFVNIGRDQDHMSEILSGLNDGEQIVVSSIDKVVDKAKVVEEK
ncbi:MAG TPA: efflux RND transporter periplasmic adaptor subunit, partial [Bacillota bacterium]|nr:efflux RND transporter periplasmic adaptor subunit [Bacillota bacterium]